MTADTTAATTLADRARAAWAAQQEHDRRDATNREAARVERVRYAATNRAKEVLDVTSDLDAWTVRPAAPAHNWSPDTADITLDGLRLTYEHSISGTLLLTWRCPAAGCGANRQTSVSSPADLGHALATVDEDDLAPGNPWLCAACLYRRRDAATRDATPEPTFAEQLEQLVRRIARDEIGQIQEPPF